MLPLKTCVQKSARITNPTRLELDRDALRKYIEAGPTLPPWTSEDRPEDDEEGHLEELPTPSSESPDSEAAEPLQVAPVVADELRVFISHGENMEIVEQVEELLEISNIESEVAVAEETTAIPVPEKVFDAMRRCHAAIIVVSVEEGNSDSDGNYKINENVLIEIGAAFVLYDRRVVLVWDKRIPVPSNLQGLYRCEFEGDQLAWAAGTKLLKAIQEFRK